MEEVVLRIGKYGCRRPKIDDGNLGILGSKDALLYGTHEGSAHCVDFFTVCCKGYRVSVLTHIRPRVSRGLTMNG